MMVWCSLLAASTLSSQATSFSSLLQIVALLQKFLDTGVSKSRKVDIEYGQELFWKGPKGAVKGATELTERIRNTDGWWNEVTDQLRDGCLSEENWRFLHGPSVQGCRLSEKEKASRRCVIEGADDPRLQEARFRTGTVIVANNDSRCQINNDRARQYAEQADVATLRVLQNQD
eukprot:3495625-Amphidinium_carterae.1